MTTENTAMVKKATDLKQSLASDYAKQQFALALPKHMTADRFVRVALTAINKTPALANCTKESVMACMMDCSSLGLEPDGRRAHLIPYGNKCTLIVDYKGLIELAKRSGDVAFWQAHIVCESDKFTWVDGVVHHEINWFEPRGEVKCVYSHVRMKDGSDDYEVMTLEEVNAICKRSVSGKSGPWVSDFNEMAKKTVIRRHSKRLTLSPEFRDAEAKDGDVIDLMEGEDYSEIVEEAANKLKAKRAKAQPEQEPAAATQAGPVVEPPAVDTPANSETVEAEKDDTDIRKGYIDALERAAINTAKKFSAHLTAFNLTPDNWKETAATSDLADICKRMGVLG